jgi:argininosuccinate synthase
VKIIAPWRIEEFRAKFPGRQAMIEYCEAKKIPVKATSKKPYSSDENCLHISYEAGVLEDPKVDGISVVDFGMTVSAKDAPDKEETVRIGFESGVPISVNGKKLSAIDLVTELNVIGGRNGIGRIDIVENRFVGMKSRGVYEAPGMTMLYAAHQGLEQLTLDRDLTHLRDRMAPEIAEMVYYGFWYCAKMDALMAFIKECQKPVTGEITLTLYKGNLRVSSRTSPNSLYDEAIASMDSEGNYNQTDAGGFLRILGVPLRVQGRVRPRGY